MNLTLKKGNKGVIDIMNNKAVEYHTAYLSEDLKKINNINKELLAIFLAVDKIPANKKDNLKKHELTHILGNNKIGKDTLCISVSTGLNCPMSIMGFCGNCNICYAKNHNKNYFKNTVPKNLINQIIINDVVLGNIKLHTVLNNLIDSIYCNYTENEVKNIKFLRFNVEGDILNNDILKVLDIIAGVLTDVFNLTACYSYTHNTNLKLNTVKNIVFNTSDFKIEGIKEVKTIFNIDNILDEVLNDEVILCNGNCKACSYCKNGNDKRTVYFLAHGGTFEGLTAVDGYILAYIEAKKELDYMKFIYDL